ncbi:RIP metalloprotease [Patescibacteria group bacterium]
MIVSVFTFIIVLSVLILVHELGHFLAARRAGIWVEEFGIGIPPRIWGKKIGETLYSINALPFGGFVKLHGENSGEDVTDPKRSFLGKSKKVRALVIVAGIVMNFLLAIVTFGIVYSFTGIPRQTDTIKVMDVVDSSPAQMAGITVGDILKSVNGKEVKTNSEFINLIDEQRGKKVTLGLNDRKVTLAPREDPPEGEGPLGVVISTTEIYYPPIYLRPFYGISYGFKDAVYWGTTIASGLLQVAHQLSGGVIPKGIAGPVGIYAVTSEVAKFGTLSLINFVGILSVNLAILNIIPFPALDGGRLLFIGIEAVIKRRINSKIESIVNTAGFIFLIGLLLILTFNDIKRLIMAGGTSTYINNILK